jgi:CheY-like chemotaxis protein
MMQRVFVRVVGFSGVERHALNTAFRLSQDRQSAREWSYEPWQADSPTAPKLALVDGASPDASEALAELEALGGVGIIWVGSISPAKAWKSFQRPLSWTLMLSCMDEYFTPGGDRVDLDFGHDTWPSVLESTGAHMFPEHDLRRVLLADADGDSRLYLRTKLSSFGITHIDEAANVLEAKDYLSPERMQRMGYDMVVVDLDLPGGDPWTVLAQAGSPRLKLLTQHRLSFATRMSAKVNGCTAMGKPLDPSRLNELLAKIQ